MATIIKTRSVSKSFGNQRLYENVNIKICYGDKVLICGENGSGKTTLLRLITGQLQPDDGIVYMDHTVKTAQLDQIEIPDHDLTVIQYINSLFSEAASLEKELKSLAEQFSGKHLETAMEKYDECLTRFEALGGYDYLRRREEFIHRFSLEDVLKKPVNQLSGGEQQYLRLASVLFSNASLLILDEPFTFLDHTKSSWLKDYLQAVSKTVIIVSHDFHLAREFATVVISIQDWKVQEYRNGFDAFEEKSLADRRRIKQANSSINQYIMDRESAIQQRKEWMRKAENKHQHAIMIHRLERDIKKAEGCRHEIKQSLEFDISKLVFSLEDDSNNMLIRLKNVTKELDGKTVLRKLSLSIYENEHYVILGKNGAGKTTLLDLITKNSMPTDGEIIYSRRIKVSYLRQIDSFCDNGISAYEYINQFRRASRDELEEVYTDYFEKDFWDKRLSLLSGGERKRLFLFGHLLQPFDVLVLDEPTSFVDNHTKEMIISMINSSNHCVIVVTHEPKVFNHMKGIKLHLYDGNLHLAAEGSQNL